MTSTIAAFPIGIHSREFDQLGFRIDGMLWRETSDHFVLRQHGVLRGALLVV